MSIWDNYPDYDDQELRMLVQATTETLADEAEENHELLEMSPSSASRMLAALLRDSGIDTQPADVQRLLEDPELSKRLSLEVLGLVRERPLLAERAAEYYETVARKMASPEILLLVGALVILAIKIKEVRIGNRVVKFYDAGRSVENFLQVLLPGSGGNTP
jgi:hypothetical protein